MVHPKIRRCLAALALAALVLAGLPGQAEAADRASLGETVSQLWAELWARVFPWGGEEGDDRPGNESMRRMGPPPGVPPVDDDKGSGIDPNGG